MLTCRSPLCHELHRRQGKEWGRHFRSQRGVLLLPPPSRRAPSVTLVPRCHYNPFRLSCLQVLPANTNTYIVARQDLALPFVATKVRFLPHSEHPRTVCMRVELYGCLWSE